MSQITYILLVLSLFSCDQNKSANKKQNSSKKVLFDKSDTDELKKNKEVLENKPISQKIRKAIEPDFFRIAKSDFSQFKSDNSRWFVSADGKNKLYFVPYTDYSITTAILTNEEILDTELRGLLQSEGIQINDLKKTISIDKLKSEKGIELGLSREELIEILGVPDLEKRLGNRDNLIWNFSMKETNSTQKIGGLKPFILNGLEFVVNATFTNRKLTTLVYKYEVP